MLSWRLWRSIADVDIHDPIFRRVSQMQRRPTRSLPAFQAPRRLWLLVALASASAVALASQLLALVLVAPILMITLVVAAPLYLPLVLWMAGACATGEIISGIQQEKRRRTYDLICASAQGELKATWSFATGVLHRGSWFAAMRWGVLFSLRAGLAALGLLSVLLSLSLLVNGSAFGIEQLRLLLLPLLCLALYFANMTQTIVIGHCVGLLASSFDWARRDAMLAGVAGYVALGALPPVAAGLVYSSFRWLVFEPQPLASLGVEVGALLLIIGLRELAVVALWRGLKRRLEVGWGAGSGGIPRRDALYPAA